MPIFRDHRTVLYAVSHISSEYPVALEHRAEGNISRLGLHLPFLQGLTHDASAVPSLSVHSHPLREVAAYGRPLIPFSPLHSAVRLPDAQRRVMLSLLHLEGRS